MNASFRRRMSAILLVLLAAVLLFTGCHRSTSTPAPADSQTATETLSSPGTDTSPETDILTDAATESEAMTDALTDATTETETEASFETVLETEATTVAENETVAKTEEEPTLYYVCTVTEDPVGTAFREPYKTLDSAKNLCDRMAQQGYRVVNNKGELVYAPYTELQCDILRECKWVTDYVRENEFRYGDAAVNPAISHLDKKVSCDRLVCWVMYRVGFTNQPRTQGVVVSAMAAWCERNGFERITRVEDLEPGDIVLVNWNGSYPAHTFIHAGNARNNGQYYRYDCGSNTRIQSVQPSVEGISGFWRAYRAPDVRESAED